MFRRGRQNAIRIEIGGRLARSLVAGLWAFGLLIIAVSSTSAFAAEPRQGSAADVDADPVERLRSYLQIDTTNPPGNEAEAASWLASILRDEGFEPRLLTSPEGRVSLYARWRALEGVDGPGLVLLHHIDVVPAGDGWLHPPFSGRVVDGKVWGRGALDVKALGIAQLEAMASLRRQGTRRSKDLIYLAVADEEQGGGQGVRWLLDAHPELFAGVEAVLGEGGNNRTIQGHVALWGVEVAQKRPLWLRVTARGRGGHASGFHPGSATHALIRGLQRLVDRPLDYRLTEPARLFFEALAGLGDAAGEDLRGLRQSLASEDPAKDMMPGQQVYFVDTLQVTEIDTGQGSNVVSPVATARIDGRLLPDTDDEALVAELRELLGPRLEVEVLLRADPVPPSPRDHPVWRALDRTLSVRAPVVPTFLPGTTDSRYFRQRGIAAYGFSPFAIDAADLKGIHGLDESIPVAEFLRGIEILRRVLVEYQQGDGGGGDG